jgi:subtilisin family serine protease
MKFTPRLGISALALAMTAGLASLSAPASAQGRPDFAYGRSAPISGQYIVVFKKDVQNPASEAAQIARGAGGSVKHVYTSALKGFSASLPAAALEGVRRNPNVDYIEQDQTVSLNATQSPATWGLDRVDQRDLPLSSSYTYNTTASNVYAFILDTGIRPDHVEFTGRLLPGFNTISDTNGTTDCNGHGTHVAGTVGGTTYGLAKGVSLIPVRVLGCTGSGSYSGVIAGLDWAANSGLRPAVANMSLGGGLSSSMNAAVAGAVTKGLTVVVAAGNDNVDACTQSPAAEPTAITVGSTTSSDARSSFSNFGTCVDIFAPGSSITSSSYSSATGTAVYSGTSMASPHVAGAVALVLAANPSATPAAVVNFLTSTASTNRVTSAGTGSPNLLLYTLGTGSPSNPPAANVAVKSLTATAAKKGKSTWRATTTVTIRNYETNAVVGGATVSASYSPGSAVSCVTSATTGSCTLNSSNYAMTVPSTVLTVNNVSGTNMVYNSGQNLASQITVNRP